jgi:hypothetical protein
MSAAIRGDHINKEGPVRTVKYVVPEINLYYSSGPFERIPE